MKKEYKRFLGLVYCYDPAAETTVRIDTKSYEVEMFNFKLSEWDIRGEYMKCTKKTFKDALDTAIKRLREVTK